MVIISIYEHENLSRFPAFKTNNKNSRMRHGKLAWGFAFSEAETGRKKKNKTRWRMCTNYFRSWRCLIFLGEVIETGEGVLPVSTGRLLYCSAFLVRRQFSVDAGLVVTWVQLENRKCCSPIDFCLRFSVPHSCGVPPRRLSIISSSGSVDSGFGRRSRLRRGGGGADGREREEEAAGLVIMWRRILALLVHPFLPTSSGALGSGGMFYAVRRGRKIGVYATWWVAAHLSPAP